jgi:predicted nucleic acid-binding protein
MTGAVFVDTNIFLYAIDTSEPAKQPVASAWIARLWREMAGRTSTQVLAEYYYNVARKLRFAVPAGEAWPHVVALMAWSPQPIDTDLLERARDIELRFRLNWWDCQVVAAAQLQDCVILLSEDMQDGMRIGNLTVRNPFTWQAHETIPDYPVAPSGHPRRGRPKKSRG